ncbi:uncharacterized protein BP5553_06671 [Venustampulla echinocandica]|uniref:NAD(P)-binding domain-containing protein n=1 Tax=Venustampulla echinocandica TaxID=2656787 RepID=A0A370TKL9_9HELO|nr:uncharacterized protein BP5553_06671 [Venustampulla echinocandica]RDL36059.1 hypothetical protein BP5553_06671 [Venustampulla echinocandica]
MATNAQLGADDDYIVVRNPSKLADLLTARNVDPEVVTKYLHIIRGDAKDCYTVGKTLYGINLEIADMVVSDVGGSTVVKPNRLRPTLDDPTICQDVVSNIPNSLKRIELLFKATPRTRRKPYIVVISTTGISNHGRDIAVAMDKKAMEGILLREIQTGGRGASVIRGFTAVRPSFLTDGKPVGAQKIRAAVEEEGKVAKSAIGYTISRGDVGAWIYEELVEDNAAGELKYVN